MTKVYDEEDLKRLFGDFRLERGRREREWILISENNIILLDDAGNGWYCFREEYQRFEKEEITHIELWKDFVRIHFEGKEVIDLELKHEVLK